MSLAAAMGQKLEKAYTDEEKHVDHDWWLTDQSNVESTLMRVFEGIGAPQTDKLPDDERLKAEQAKTSLLFGEVLPSGVSKMFKQEALGGAKCRFLLDLGHGCGRLMVQAFLMFPNIVCCKGVEFNETRFQLSCLALENLNVMINQSVSQTLTRTELENRSNKQSFQQSNSQSIKQSNNQLVTASQITVKHEPCTSSTLTVDYNKELLDRLIAQSSNQLDQTNNQAITRPVNQLIGQSSNQSVNQTVSRTVTFEEKSLFDCYADVLNADVIILETNIYMIRAMDLVNLLKWAKTGTRILCYNRLEDLYEAAINQSINQGNNQSDQIKFEWVKLPLPYGQDHYDASWGTARFYIYELRR